MQEYRLCPLDASKDIRLAGLTESSFPVVLTLARVKMKNRMKSDLISL